METKKKLNSTHTLVRKEVYATQKKIQRKHQLAKLLKILETIKYVDKANTTIKVLLDKTNYKKIGELLFTLSSSLDNNLSEIIVLENKWEEIKKLKHNFINKLVGIAEDKMDKLTEKAASDFMAYIEGFDPEDEKEFKIDYNVKDTEDISSIVLELKLFNRDDTLYKNLASHFQNQFGKTNKALLDKISKMIAFKTPSISLLKSYRNYVNYFFTIYQNVISVESDDLIYSQFLQSLVKLTNVFLRRVIDVFDLETADLWVIKDILGVLGSFEKFNDMKTKSDSLFEGLQLYFKKIVLNARQHKLCLDIKNSMEAEDWTIEPIGSETEHILKRHLIGDLSVFTQYVIYNDVRYQFTESFALLLNALDELQNLNSELENLNQVYETKIKDIIELYLKNCENLILHGMALNFSKIKKINTKILGNVIRSCNTSIKFLINFC